MLSKACERFRDAFEPRAPEPGPLDRHRRSCRACDTWAARLETFTVDAAPRPLPEGLRRRLRNVARRSVAREVVSCGEVERLWRGTRERVRRGSIGDPRVAEHLRSCRRCGALYATLGAAFTVTRLPLPGALLERLQKIAQRPPVPWWIRDGQVAVAASAIFTVALLTLLGNPAVFLSQARTTVTTTASSLVAAGEARSDALLTALSGEMESGVVRGLERLERGGAAYRRLWRQIESFYDQQLRDELLPSPDAQGDDDDDATREGTA